MSGPEVSVVICSRNRSRQLQTVLESMCVINVPDRLSWEVVIVDNGSTDATPDVVDGFRTRLPIRRVSEPQPGLSNARNRGVSEAQGAYIIWTDDDVLLDEKWLDAYVEAIRANPEAAVFGGRVTPVLLGEAPPWWKSAGEELDNLLARRDFGPDPVALSISECRLPFGANFAVRAREQRMVRYDPALGVAPGVRRLGEETQVIRRILQCGGTGMWVPRAEVLHQITPERLTLDYAKTYFQAVGETWAYLDSIGAENFMGPEIGDRTPRLMGAPRWVWREALRARVAYRLTRITSPPAVWMKYFKMSTIYLAGLNFWRKSRPAAPVRLPPTV